MHFLLYVKLPIELLLFLSSLISGASKKDFPKISENGLSENILILPPKFYYIELTQLTKHNVSRQVWLSISQA